MANQWQTELRIADYEASDLDEARAVLDVLGVRGEVETDGMGGWLVTLPEDLETELTALGGLWRNQTHEGEEYSLEITL